MKKILTVVGARPQFIKASVMSRLIKNDYKNRFEEVLLHTGQHYDRKMSEVFFEELQIRPPDINLNIGSGPHGAMTGKMLEGIELVALKEQPDGLLVYGDTNSTLAGALAASKLHIPVFHVEAGLRSYNKQMPEEQNRVLTDHLSSLLFCPTQRAEENLKQENISQGVFLSGDIMLDASMFYSQLAFSNSLNIPDEFVLITIHRAENTDSLNRLTNIISAINQADDLEFVLPLHPRTLKMIKKNNLSFKKHIHVIDPVGYLQMVYLESKCRYILTDSGGIQKEAFFFRKPCITMRDETEWVETVDSGWNTLVGADKTRIKNALRNVTTPREYPKLYGDGHSGNNILEIMIRWMDS